MEDARILILMPTLNNVDDIDASIESIWAQHYNKENIYVTVMDFGSTDGTYEKLLRYSSRHFGVYRNHRTKNRRLMLSYMAKMGEFTHPGGQYSFQAVLYPGDVLYPDFIVTCSELFIRHWAENPTMVVCETDIWSKEKKVVHQSPLFEKDRVINGSHELTEFGRRGYRHQIQCMVRGFQRMLKRFSGEQNEQRWWNKLYIQNIDQLSLYIRQPLACQKNVTYEDEREEVLLRWESIVANLRGYAAKYEKTFDEDFESIAKNTQAEYALWRSWLLRQKNDDARKKEMEDCFLLSGCIAPSIMETELYIKMEQYIMKEDLSMAGWLGDYFATHGMN